MTVGLRTELHHKLKKGIMCDFYKKWVYVEQNTPPICLLGPNYSNLSFFFKCESFI